MRYKEIRQIIREELLAEKAVTTARAGKEKLALCVVTDGTDRDYILYDPAKLLGAADKIIARYDRIRRVDLEYFTHAIVGVLAVLKSKRGYRYGAATVRWVAARKGYGPLMYDIVMSEEGGLIPDRRKVSDFAQSVWRYYFNNRSDVLKKPLDNIKNPKTKPKIDDAPLHDPNSNDSGANPLNYAYFATKKQDTARLMQNHAKAMKELELRNLSMSDIRYIASLYFNERYDADE